MKKMLLILYALIFVFASGPICRYRAGDINGDGKLTRADLVALKDHLLGKITLTGKAAAAADLNGDGRISLTDFIRENKLMR